MHIGIGSRINEVRKNNELTQLEFAKEIGISQTHVSKIEKSIEFPSETLIKYIAFRYCVDENWLKTGEGGMQLNAYDSEESRFKICIYKLQSQFRECKNNEQKCYYADCVAAFTNIVINKNRNSYTTYLEKISEIFFSLAVTLENTQTVCEYSKSKILNIEAKNKMDTWFVEIQQLLYEILELSTNV